MSTAPQVSASSRFSATQIAIFSLPALPLAALQLPLYINVPAYYTGVLGITAQMVGYALIAARLIDAFMDPMLGIWADRIHSPYGRRHTFFLGSIFFTTPAAILLFMPDWFMPILGLVPNEQGFWYLLVAATCLSVGYTATFLPYTSWMAEMSGDYDERSRFAAGREISIITGTLLAAGVPLFMTKVVGFDNPHTPLTTLAIFIGILLPLAAFVMARNTPEPTNYTVHEVKFFEGLRYMWKNKLFVRLATAFLFNVFANGLPATLLAFFASAVLKDPGAFQVLLALYFVSGLAGVVLWLPLAKRLGKHRTWCAAMIVACCAFVWSPLLGPGDTFWFGLILVVAGLSLAADLILPLSMQADVIDADTATSGEQRSGLYFAVWQLVNKLALAGTAVSLIILGYLGFDAHAAKTNPLVNQPEHAILALEILFAVVPVVLKLIAVSMIWNFPLGREQQHELREKIEKTAEAEGIIPHRD